MITGDEIFSHCEKYRLLLTRESAAGEGRCLWIGMNPSTADASANDPTVTRECDFTWRWGFRTYVKCNVMDYRATDPKELLRIDTPSSVMNLSTIVREATYASCIIACWGAIPGPLLVYAMAVRNALKQDGREIFCLGRTKHGAPKHPLYLPKITERVPYFI